VTLKPLAGRHLSVPILLDHVAAGVTTVYPFPGEPAVDLLIEGAVPRITLRATTDEPVTPPPNTLQHVTVASGFIEGTHRLTVAIASAELLIDGHAMVCVVADRIQLEGRKPLEAVQETLLQWRSVLAARTRLSFQAEVGLMGELLVLEALAADGSAADTLAMWRGSLAEEHDFGLPTTDVEVKTTSGERREHWIGGLQQLTPTGTRPLVLVSLQVTRGGAAGRTLPAMIGDLDCAFNGSPNLADKLAAVGWADDAADLFVDRWHLRSAPKTFVVDDAFPALTKQSLAHWSRDLSVVRDVHYRLDLHDRLPDDIGFNDMLTSGLSRLAKDFA
jgi:hypothetical protein